MTSGFLRFAVAVGLVAASGLGIGGRVAAAGETFQTVDAAGTVGLFTSLQMDASGFPVISYYEATTGGGNLKFVRCNDTQCAGGDETIQTLDTGFNVGRWSSLRLDGSGLPVIAYSYVGVVDTAVKLVRCNDAWCAGGDETIQVLDSGGYYESMQYTSLQLDDSGFPVVTYKHSDYHYPTSAALKVVRCNDTWCTGGDETISIIEAVNLSGWNTSLQLDESGYPVISYSSTNLGYRALKVARCNDMWCAGGDETIQVLDELGVRETSLQLDGSGFPVIAYFDLGNSRLKLVRCNDTLCAGDDETIRIVDSAGWVGESPSLQLDSAGFPVISYHDMTNADLKLIRCNDAVCVGDDETIRTLDAGGDVGQYTSLQLDASGFPVISYYDANNRDLKLVRCDDATCSADNDADGTPDADDDAYPNDPTETVDTDSDGIGDNTDPDDDGDGQRDLDEARCGSNPLDAISSSIDTDHDGLPDCVDGSPAIPPTTTTTISPLPAITTTPVSELPATGYPHTTTLAVGLIALVGGLTLALITRPRRRPPD